MTTFRIYVVGLAMLCTCFALADQTKRPILAVKAATPPVIDGDLSDPCWKTAPIATEFSDLQNGTLVPDQTIVRTLYDGKYIYVAFECLDRVPGSIVGRETVRDNKFGRGFGSVLNTEDNVEVDFDPFLTSKGNDISQFSVNAIGTRSAALAGGRASKAEWKGDWDAATKRTPTGWTCEMRIPWASLNYPSGKKVVTMGIDFQRFQYRTQVWSMWSNVTNQNFLNLEGIWTDVEPPQLKYQPTLSLLPYSLSGVTNRSVGEKIGLDARYTITPQLTAVGSANPDFSSIQGAIQSIQFSHAELFVPEVRPFFTEGSNDFYAQTNINDIGAFFYSNRIPTFDLGAKVYGKLTSKDTIGVLDTASFDGRNDVVARYLHDYGPTSRGGAMVVSTDNHGVQNTDAIVDQHFRTGKLAIEGIGATSIGPGAGGGAQVLGAYYADKYLTSLIQYSGVSNNFLTPDGFIPYTGYKGFTNVEDWSASWKHGFWRSTELTITPLDWVEMSGRPYQQGVIASYALETRSDWHLELDYNRILFDGSRDDTVGFNIIRGVTNRFCQVGLQVLTGEQGSERGTFVGPSANLRLFKRLDVLYQGGFENRQGLDQQHVITLNYEISPTQSFGGRIVTHNADTNAYFFFHKSGGNGTEFYFLVGDPNAERSVREVQLKMVFAVK